MTISNDPIVIVSAVRTPMGGFQGDLQAAGVDLAAAGQIQGGAMVDGGADDRQAERHIDGRAEAFVFQHGQALVVVHRQHCVAVLQILGGKQSVGWQWTAQVHAFIAQAL